jgi:hypothetical protein
VDTEINAGKLISPPMVDVRLTVGAERTGQKALIDTGASVTMFPRGIADLLGPDMPAEGEDGDDRIIVCTMSGNEQCIV